MDTPALTTLAEQIGARVAQGPSEYLELDRLRRQGREVWRPVLIGLLSLLFLEVVLQQRFARVRP